MSGRCFAPDSEYAVYHRLRGAEGALRLEQRFQLPRRNNLCNVVLGEQNFTQVLFLRYGAGAEFFGQRVRGRLAERLRLSNAEQAILALGARSGDAGLPEEQGAKVLLYRLGPDAYRSRLLLAWADSGAPSGDEGWKAALSLPERWQAPVFPIGGNDVMALGELKGRQVGELLKRLEQEWISSGFVLDRGEILAKAKALIARGADPRQCRAIQTAPIKVAASASETGMTAISSNTSRPLIGPVAVSTSLAKN